MKSVAASEANRHFSSLLRDVSGGETVTILSRGKPVATIAPVRSGIEEREAARMILLQRLRQQRASGTRDWTRDELYES